MRSGLFAIGVGMLFFGAILVMNYQPMVSASEALVGGLANLSPDYRQWHFYLNIGYALAVIGIIIMGSAVIPSKKSSMFICGICNHAFSSEAELYNHTNSKEHLEKASQLSKEEIEKKEYIKEEKIPTKGKLKSSQNTSSTKIYQRSPFWYLLPIFLGIIGGIIAWSLLKNTDHQKAKRALVIGIVFSILPFVGWIGLQAEFGTQNPFYVMASGGMSPVLEVYDIILVEGNTPFEDIEIGDIIVYNRPSDHNRVITARVVSILDDDPKTLRTKGDANPTSIPGTNFPITDKEYIGKVVYTLPQVGYVIMILGFFVIVIGILGIKHQKYKKTR